MIKRGGKMEERILGNNFKVSAVGLGCMGFSHGYGVPTEKSEARPPCRGGKLPAERTA